jgi:hypothetical protein
MSVLNKSDFPKFLLDGAFERLAPVLAVPPKPSPNGRATSLISFNYIVFGMLIEDRATWTSYNSRGLRWFHQRSGSRPAGWGSFCGQLESEF